MKCQLLMAEPAGIATEVRMCNDAEAGEQQRSPPGKLRPLDNRTPAHMRNWCCSPGCCHPHKVPGMQCKPSKRVTLLRTRCALYGAPHCTQMRGCALKSEYRTHLTCAIICTRLAIGTKTVNCAAITHASADALRRHSTAAQAEQVEQVEWLERGGGSMPNKPHTLLQPL